MSLVMSKKWRLICSVRPKSLLVSGVPVMGISVITHVSFLGFAFATLAVFDTVHDSFAWSACKPKYTHNVCAAVGKLPICLLSQNSSG